MPRERTSNKYWLIFLYSFRSQIKNWPVLLSLSAIFVTVFFVFFYLFKAAGSFSNTISTNHLIWYCMLNECIIVVGQWFHLSVQADIKNGTVANSLIKPISYLTTKITEGIASSLVNFMVLGAITVGMTVWGTGFFPFTWLQFIYVACLAFTGVFLQLLLTISLGLFAFWVDDVTPLYWLFMKSLFIFGGLFMPLITYPLFLQTISSYTPFPFIMGVHSAQILITPFSWAVLGMTFFWMGASIACMSFLFKHGLKHENRYGGAL